MAAHSIYKSLEGRAILLDFYDGVTGRWTFPHEKTDIPTQFGDTRVVTAGQRGSPVLMLLHGSASNLLGWGAAIPYYMEDFFVVAPDIPGEAGRSGPLRPSWNNDEYVQWLDGLLNGLGVERAALLGLSLGGWIAAKYAAHRPGRVSRLVLLAPGGISPARISATLKTILYSVQQEKGADKLKRLVFGPGDIPPEVSRFFDLLQRHFAPRFGSPRLLKDAELAGISCPLLMLSGGEDAFFNARRTVKRLKKLLPGAEVHVVSTGNHGYGLRGQDCRVPGRPMTPRVDTQPVGEYHGLPL